MTDSTPPSATPSPAPAKKKGSIGRLIFRLFIVLVVLVVIGLVGLFLSVNTLVRAGVVRGGKYATDQETGLQAANLSFFGGALSLDTLEIANLKDQGYKEPSLLKMKSCQTTVDSGSLFSHTVVVHDITIDGLEITVEQRGMKNNLNDLMDIIKKKTPAAGSSSDTSNSAPGKELKIEQLTLKNMQIHLRSDIALLNKDFTLKDISMKDPTNPDGRPMKLAELVSRIMLQVSQQLLDDPNLPKEFRDGMKNVQFVVNDVQKELNKNVSVFSKDLKGLSTNPAGAIQNLSKDLPGAGKNVQDLGKNLQGLIPGSKPPTPSK